MLANRIVAPEHNLLTVATDEIGRRAQAGQFVQIRVPGGAVFLPRPFSFLAAEDDRCTFLSRAIGPGTRALAGLADGAELDLLGPLGHGFDLAAAAAGEVILVGGGVGVPPLVHAAAELAPLTGTALIGAARAGFLLCEQEFADLGWHVQPATDDGSRGHHGLVTDLLDQALACSPRQGETVRQPAPAPQEMEPRAVSAIEPSQRRPTVLACGPHPMLRRCAELAAATGAACQVALEEPMACGFGVCLGCAIRVHVRNSDDPPGPAYALVCRDGPVFPAQHVLW